MADAFEGAFRLPKKSGGAGKGLHSVRNAHVHGEHTKRGLVEADLYPAGDSHNLEGEGREGARSL